MSWVIVAMLLEEVRPPYFEIALEKNTTTQTMICTPPPESINSDIPQEESGDTVGASQKDAQKPPPLRSLLTRPILTSIANYAMITLLQMACAALIPLVWSTPVKFGGLDLSPASIGSVFGCMDGIFQFAVFPRAVGRFGLRCVFATCIAACAVVIIMFPLENFMLRHATGGSTMKVGSLIFVQLLSYSTLLMGFSTSLISAYFQGRVTLRIMHDLLGAAMIFISSAIPSKRSLGAVNGISRMFRTRSDRRLLIRSLRFPLQITF
jgi:hypothetical protein